MAVNFAFLDSGTGGLPYLLHLKQKFPKANCVYLADTKNFPYGQKTSEQIIDCAKKICNLIIKKYNPHAIIIACNTISVTALNSLRKTFPMVHFIGTVPAIKPAALLSKTKKIGLLATNATVNNPYTLKLEKDFASDCEIITRGDPELISFIEHKFFQASEEERFLAVKPAVDFFKNNNCDVIVLACTHFLNMVDYIKKYAGVSIQVVDSREGVVNRALALESINIEDTQIGKTSLYVTSVLEDNDIKTYVDFCKNLNITFGGSLD